MILSTDGSFRLTATELRENTGWELKPEGLCKGDVCVPVKGRAGVVIDDRIDLRAFAALIGQPLAIDDDAGVAVLGESAEARAAQRLSMHVDDFAMVDLDGNEFRWSSIGRKKKVLFAWASW
jgi:hypothetical protein